MKKRILTLILSMAIAVVPTISPVYAEQAENLYYYYDLSKKFNTSIFAADGDTVSAWGVKDASDETYEGFSATPASEGTNFWNTYYSQTAKKYLNSYSADTGILSYVNSDLNKGVGSYTGYEALENNAVLTQKLTSDIPFKLDNSQMNKDGKNAFVFKGDSANFDILTVNGSQSSSKYLNVLFAVGTNTVARQATITLEFTDGTKKDYKFNLAWARDQGGWQVYCQKPNLALSGGNITTAGNEDKNSMKLRAVSVNTSGKAIKNITIGAHWTALVAMTEIPLTSEEYWDIMSAEITEAWEAVLENPTIENMKKMITYADEMKANKIDLSELSDNAEEIIKGYKDKVSQFKDVEPCYYDLSNLYNTSIFGSIGDSADSWGFSDKGIYNGFSSSLTPTGSVVGWNTYKSGSGYANGFDEETSVLKYVPDDINKGVYNNYANPAGYDELTDNATLIKELDYVPFKLSDNRTVSGKNAYAFGGTSTADYDSVTISGSGASSDYLHLLFAVGNWAPYPIVKVDFNDGTSKQFKFVLNWAREQSGSHYYCQRPDLTFTGGQLTMSEAKDANSSKLRAIAVPTGGKSIKSVTVQAYYTTLVAMTEIPLNYDDFSALKKDDILSAWEAVKADESLSNMTKMLMYADEAEKSGIPMILFDDTKDGDEYAIEKAIKTYRDKIVRVENVKAYRKDENTVAFEFEFSNPVVAASENITILKNDETLTDYSLGTDGKKLIISVNETRNGGNVYELRVNGVVNANSDYSSYKLEEAYELSYTVPDYFSFAYNSGKFSVKNNSADGKDNYIAYAVLYEDGVATDRTLETKDEKGKALSGDNVKAFLWNDKQKTLSSDEKLEKCVAEENKSASLNNPDFDASKNLLTIEGYTLSKKENKVVNIKIEDKKKANALILADSVKTGENGYFKVEYQFPESVYDSAMELRIFIGGDDFSEAINPENEKGVEKIIYYTTTEEKRLFAESLKGMSEEEIKNKISDILNTFSISFTPAEKISAAVFAKLIFANKDKINPDKVTDIQKLIKQLAVIGALNENKEDELFDSDSKLMYKDVMEYKSVLDNNGATLFEIYENGISADGLKAIKKALLSKTYSATDEKTEYELLIENLKNEIFLNAINYPKNGGTGYLTSLLTSKNADSVGISISKFVNTTDCLNYIYNSKPYESVSAFEEYLSKYKAPQSQSSSGTTSSKNNKNSSVSLSGININEEPEKSDNSLFTDVSEAHWAYKSIASLYEKNIISGKGNKIFDPDGYILRGELVKIICTTYNLSGSQKSVFTDAAGKWYEEYADIAFENGIINGVSETEFGGDSVISRQDLCVILYRLKNSDESYELTFTDSESISDYAKNTVSYMANHGIINGFEDGSFRPFEGCTRAQVAKIIDLFLQLD